MRFISFARRTCCTAPAIVLLAGAAGAAVHVTPLLTRQPLLATSRAAVRPGSARDLALKTAGVDIFAGDGAAQLARLWNASTGLVSPSSVTRHKLTVTRPGVAAGRAATVAFVSSHAGVLFAGGKATGYNALAQARFAAIGFHPSFGSDSYTQPEPNVPVAPPPAKAPIPVIASVTVNGVRNGAFTGAPDDAVLVTGSGLAYRDAGAGTVLGPTAMRATFGPCAGFDLIVQAVDPDGKWIEATSGASSAIVVDRRAKRGTLRITGGTGTVVAPVAYDALLEVDTYTIAVTLMHGRVAVAKNPLGIAAANSSFSSARTSDSASAFGSGRDVVGKNIRLIGDAAYLGATATAITQLDVALPQRATVGIEDAAAVVSRPNAVDLTTAIDWTFAPASAIAYALAFQIESPAGVNPISGTPEASCKT